MTLPFHPLANLFPLIEGAEFDELVASVRANGLRDPITVHDGLVIDGRNRQRACEAAEVDCDYQPLPMGAEPLQFVIDKNLKRRHLNESQRAMVAANLATMRQGERTDVEPSAKLQKVAQNDAAKRLSVSPRSVADAVKVKNEAAPELRRAVEQGAVPVSSAAKLVSSPAEEQRRVAEAVDPAKAARTEISRHNRDERIEEIVRNNGSVAPQLKSSKKYAVIYADPPWQFDVWSRETGLEKCPDRHYPTMTVEEICALPVSDLVAETALLFLWITVPKLDRMQEIFRAWGRVLCDDPEYGIIRQPWQYVSNYNWDKVNIGPGRWNRNQHEHLLIARIGDVPAPLPADRMRSNYSEASTEHSAKPDHFATLIEKQFPHLPKIELFRRGRGRPGWDVWGNEAEQSPESILPTIDSPTPRVDVEPAPVIKTTGAGSIPGEDDPWKIPDFCRRIAPILFAGILSLAMMSSTFALDCTKSPDRTPGPFWRYRLIDNQQCWYRSESVLPKSDLRWAGDPRPELTMEFGDSPLKPTYVQTVSFKPVESPKESLGLMTFFHIGILAGFGLAIGGLLWPLRRGRNV